MPFPPALTSVPLLRNAPPAQNELLFMCSATRACVSRLYSVPHAGWPSTVSGLCSTLSMMIACDGETIASCIAATPVVPFCSSSQPGRGAGAAWAACAGPASMSLWYGGGGGGGGGGPCCGGPTPLYTTSASTSISVYLPCSPSA